MANVGIAKFNALYRLERKIKDLPPHEKYHQRQRIAAKTRGQALPE